VNDVEKAATAMLGMTLVTHQTGPEGKTVHKLLVEQGCNIKKEYYVDVLLIAHPHEW